MLTSIKKAFSINSTVEKQSVTMSSKLQKAQEFLQLIKQRRSIHALNNTPILPDAELISLIKSTVRESPSAFNSQTSRVVILLGEDHKNYWSNIVQPSMRKAITDEAIWAHIGPRYDLFKQAYGTALFFEDENVIKDLQKDHAVIAKLFPQWSTHASGMAQINTWTALEIAGYGANLQHNVQVAPATIVEKYGVPAEWTLHAELVFGTPIDSPPEKKYIDDAERFKVFGAKLNQS